MATVIDEVDRLRQRHRELGDAQEGIRLALDAPLMSVHEERVLLQQAVANATERELIVNRLRALEAERAVRSVPEGPLGSRTIAEVESEAA